MTTYTIVQSGGFVRQRLIGIFAAMVLLSGCQTPQPASYSNYADNTFLLRQHGNVKVRVVSITDRSDLNNACRGIGEIRTTGDRTIPHFIRDSLNDELKFAGIYSDEPSATQLEATLHAANFSSMSGITGGYWSFSLGLKNPVSGQQVTTDYRYQFESGLAGGLDGVAACQNTSASLAPAVQRLLNKAITDPAFGNLIAR
jgi:hypothetical protein